MKKINTLAISLALFGLACAKHHAKTSLFSAKAVIQAKSGSQVAGIISFEQVSKQEVVISGKVTGLKPSSKHGFHVHEKGDCSATDGSSAGSHFNPTQQSHGALNVAVSHIGDLGNLVTDDNGVAEFRFVKKNASLTDTNTSYVGKAVIIHDKEDDFTTQPTGNAGGRIGCGVVVKN